MRKSIYKFHKWLGIAVAVPMLITSVTGAVLLFRPELEQVSDPQLYRVARGDSQTPIGQLIRIAQKVHPAGDAIVFEFPFDQERPARVFFREGNKPAVVIIDPYSGKVLGQESERQQWLAALYTIHTQFFMSRVGEAMVALLGLSLAALAISGFYVYRGAFRHLFRLRRGRHQAIFMADLHRLFGVWSLIMLCSWGATGFWMNHESLLPKAEEMYRQHYLPPLPLERYVKTSTTAFPGWSPTALILPEIDSTRLSIDGEAPPGHLGSLFGAFGASVELDALSSSVTHILDPRKTDIGTKVSRVVYPLHTAYYNKRMFSNILLRLLYATAGLAPAVLSLTGAVLWRMRVRSARSSVLLLPTSQ